MVYEDEMTIAERISSISITNPYISVAAFYVDAEDQVGSCANRAPASRLAHLSQLITNKSANVPSTTRSPRVKHRTTGPPDSLICVYTREIRFPDLLTQMCDYVVYMNIALTEDTKEVQVRLDLGYDQLVALDRDWVKGLLLAPEPRVVETLMHFEDSKLKDHLQLWGNKIKLAKISGLAFFFTDVPMKDAYGLHEKVWQFFSQAEDQVVLLVGLTSVSDLQQLLKFAGKCDILVLVKHHYSMPSKCVITDPFLTPVVEQDYKNLAALVQESGFKTAVGLSLPMVVTEYHLSSTEYTNSSSCDKEHWVNYVDTCPNPKRQTEYDDNLTKSVQKNGSIIYSFQDERVMHQQMSLFISKLKRGCITAFYVEYEDWMGDCNARQSITRLKMISSQLNRTEDITEPARTTPVHVESTTTPVHVQSTTTPFHMKSTTTPVHVKSTTAPVHVKSTTTPVHVKSTTTPVHVTSTTTPVHVASTTTPAHVKSTTTPVPVKSTTTTVHVKSTTTPVHVTSTSTPVHVTSTTTPVHVKSTTTPVHVESTTTPVHVESTTSPAPVEHTAPVICLFSRRLPNLPLAAQLCPYMAYMGLMHHASNDRFYINDDAGLYQFLALRQHNVQHLIIATAPMHSHLLTQLRETFLHDGVSRLMYSISRDQPLETLHGVMVLATSVVDLDNLHKVSSDIRSYLHTKMRLKLYLAVQTVGYNTSFHPLLKLKSSCDQLILYTNPFVPSPHCKIMPIIYQDLDVLDKTIFKSEKKGESVPCITLNLAVRRYQLADGKSDFNEDCAKEYWEKYSATCPDKPGVRGSTTTSAYLKTSENMLVFENEASIEKKLSKLMQINPSICVMATAIEKEDWNHECSARPVAASRMLAIAKYGGSETLPPPSQTNGVLICVVEKTTLIVMLPGGLCTHLVYSSVHYRLGSEHTYIADDGTAFYAASDLAMKSGMHFLSEIDLTSFLNINVDHAFTGFLTSSTKWIQETHQDGLAFINVPNKTDNVKFESIIKQKVELNSGSATTPCVSFNMAVRVFHWRKQHFSVVRKNGQVTASQ
ncbi:uncharacterized protein LOC119396849 [Rhipicephalus sanguineus]|uniref:uncharacterized protein LOC119396849 n=1 Tax=Rhipicephalus sanguineus TaxID=34632 RepID=UPI0020C55F10|nr:uncharacterized protein LOC119396849 [Rhipicephalus sanguineus]